RRREAGPHTAAPGAAGGSDACVRRVVLCGAASRARSGSDAATTIFGRRKSMKRIWLYNAELLCPDGQVHGGLTVEEGRITAILPGDARPAGDFEKIDLQGAFLAPGFIDIHVHGGGGGDFMDGTPESFEAALSMHLAHGTTALCPTTLA